MRWAEQARAVLRLCSDKEGDLGELLVRNGLARNYGFKTTPPGLKNSRIELEKLQQFENQAKQEKIGAWGVSAGRLNAHVKTSASFSSFVPEEKTPSRSAPADSFAVVSPTPQPVRLIARTSPGDKNRTACQGKDTAWQDRHQHCDRKRANDRAGNRTRDGGANYRSATVQKC